MSVYISAITTPSPTSAEHSLHLRGHYSQVEGPSRAMQSYRRGQEYIQEAVRELPRTMPGPRPVWSNVENVLKMIF
jgi:hypothetical protein